MVAEPSRLIRAATPARLCQCRRRHARRPSVTADRGPRRRCRRPAWAGPASCERLLRHLDEERGGDEPAVVIAGAGRLVDRHEHGQPRVPRPGRSRRRRRSTSCGRRHRRSARCPGPCRPCRSCRRRCSRRSGPACPCPRHTTSRRIWFISSATGGLRIPGGSDAGAGPPARPDRSWTGRDAGRRTCPCWRWCSSPPRAARR